MRASLARRGRALQTDANGAGGEMRRPERATLAAVSNRTDNLAFDSLGGIAVMGEIFDDDSDAHSPEESRAARLLSRYRRDGIAALERTPGAFAAAVVDTPTVGPASLTLVRDGSGARCLYWGVHDGRVFFGAEPKAVLAVPGFPRRLRLNGLAQYLSYSFQPGTGTMLEDIHEVPLGATVRFDDVSRAPTTNVFFRFEDEDARSVAKSSAEEAAGGDAYWTAKTRACIERAIANRLPHDETTGIFLSGGLDSSLVTAEVQRQLSRRAPSNFARAKTYAIHFGRDFPNELAFAKSVAERAGTEHTEVEIRPRDFLPRLRSIVAQLDDPIGDPITIPNFELARRASEEVGVIFNGEGGDPLFGGPKNLAMMLHHWYGLDDTPFARERAYLRSYRRAYEERQRLLTPDAWRGVDEHAALEAPLHAFFAAKAPASLLNKLMAINIRLKGASLILPKVDRMLGAHQIRVRAPLFDAELIRLSFQMPPTMKLRGGVEKWVLKRAFEDLLPPDVIARPKSGMRVPVHYWFQGELQRYAKKILHPREIKRVGLFNPERVAQLLAYKTEEGPGRYGIRLWMLLTFEIWRRVVIEGETI